MGKLYSSIDDRVRTFIEAQRMFFVATAPAAASGHVNVSPKGLDSFRILAPTRVAYLDYIGSGAETIAHCRENGRIAFMFCAFEGPPLILRLHGQGRVAEPQDAEFPDLLSHFEPRLGVRAVICVDIDRIADSCGFGVPLYRFEGQRSQLPAWADRKGDEALVSYQRENNAASIDGLPALRWTSEP